MWFLSSRRRSDRQQRNIQPFVIEALEPRQMLAAQPTGTEQEILELVNQFRANPQQQYETLVADSQVRFFMQQLNASIATGRNIMRDVQGGKAPLAWDMDRAMAADTHSSSMKNANQLRHSAHAPENVATANITAPTALNALTIHSQLAIQFTSRGSSGDANRDGFLDNAPHRRNLLNPDATEIGIGFVTNRRGSQNEAWLTEQFVEEGNANPHVLGVIYNDANRNGRYNAGEGVSNVTITISNASNTYTTRSMAAGGYQRQVLPGTYTVTASGPTIAGTVTMGTITVGADNVKLDLKNGSGNGGGPPADRGAISGVVFRDNDADGRRDSASSGLNGWTVFIDANNNGRLDGNEPRTATGGTGFYSFESVAPGQRRVRLLNRSGWNTTTPVSQVVTVQANDTTTSVNFGARMRGNGGNPSLGRGAISGIVFRDNNADGRRDSPSSGLAGWTIFIDADNDGRLDADEPRAVTTSNGFYKFDSVAPGQRNVRVAIRSGFTPTTPRNQIVTVLPDDTTTSVNFGVR